MVRGNPKIPDCPGKCAHYPTIVTLNIQSGVMNLIYNIGWSLYFDVNV